MKKISLFLLFFFIFNIVQAQKKAITETGEEVILFEDGTWKYADEQESAEKEIPVNPKKFEKDPASTFLLKSKKLNVGIYINPKKWLFGKGSNNKDAEYEFQLKDEDLYAMMITEKAVVPIESLRSLVLVNAKKIAPDVKIIKEEYRTVNGIKVLLLQLKGTTHGIKFSYFGYYFSNPNGTVQLVTYTTQNLLEHYKPEMEKFLNGFVELD